MSNTNKMVSLIPTEYIEQEAMKQIYFVLTLEFLKKLAVMPDVHAGKVMVIGGVALLDGVISPVFVGMDVSCSVLCMITDIPIPDWTKEERDAIRDKIIATIPLGYHRHEIPKQYPIFKSASGDKELTKKVNSRLGSQLGTLGGGKMVASRPSIKNTEIYSNCLGIPKKYWETGANHHHDGR